MQPIARIIAIQIIKLFFSSAMQPFAQTDPEAFSKNA
jgi:hypothetical protein